MLLKDSENGFVGPSKIIHHDLLADDPVRRKPDITVAKSKLGWEPKVALEDGLKETIDYFKNQLDVS